MRMELEITAQVDFDEIIEALTHDVDVEEFVISLDDAMADEGFTFRVIKKLAGSLAKEYEDSIAHVTERVLENQFISRTSTWTPEDITNYENALGAMKEIVKIVESLET